MTNLKQKIGILRSVAIYYWKPFNRRRLMRFYRQFIQPGDLCFDLGAHLGNRTEAWHHLGATVVAVEPQPLCMAYMQKRLGKHKNIFFIEKAVGDKETYATLYINQLSPTISTLGDETWRNTMANDASYECVWEETMTVEVTTLDALIATYGMPAFCKLDIENYEAEALKGLSKAIPAVSVEFYPKTTQRAIECIELLENLGKYEYNWSYGESQKMNEPQWLTASRMKDIFAHYKPDDSYGDFYARLKT
jgi:FkbM family methyltransferase